MTRTRTLLLAAALLGTLPFAATADEPRPKGADANALALLDDVSRAYRALDAYADQGEFVTAFRSGETTSTFRQPCRLAVVRPNKLNVDAGLARMVCDGKTLTTVVPPLKRYFEGPAPARVTFDTLFAGGPVGSAVFGGPSRSLMVVLVSLVAGENPARAVRDLGDALTLDADRTEDGVTSKVLKVSSEGGASYRLAIDPDTKLLRSIELAADPKALESTFPKGKDGAEATVVETFRWSAGAVSTKAPADDAFAFQPPKDFTRVAELAAAPKKDDEGGQKFKVESLAGKPAPDFTLTVFDGPDKTRTLTKADLSGKVVLIDFWATWCVPCLNELPEIQKLIEAYAKDKKEVVVVALSQDNDPKDPADVRKLIEETLGKKKITLTGNPVGRIALDPSNTVGEAFQVEGYPTVVILDGKGNVAKVHVGAPPDVLKTLTKEIDALLDGKADAGK